MAGAWSARVESGDYLHASGLLVLAGADHDLIDGLTSAVSGRQRHGTASSRQKGAAWSCDTLPASSTDVV
jgi:hypothetical protein